MADPIAEVGGSGVLLGAFATIGPPEVDATLEPGRRAVLLHGRRDRCGSTIRRALRRRPPAAALAAARRLGADVLVAVSAAVRAFQAEAEAADDVTIVAVGRDRLPERRSTHHPAVALVEVEQEAVLARVHARLVGA